MTDTPNPTESDSPTGFAADLTLPDTYRGLVARAAELFGDTEAVSDGEISMTWTELVEQIDRCAAALVARRRCRSWTSTDGYNLSRPPPQPMLQESRRRQISIPG